MFRHRFTHLLGWLWSGLALLAWKGQAASFSDAFAGREVITAPAFSLSMDNSGATRESYEPIHAGRPGGRSLWISWVAPENGLLTLNTEGSTVDTIMAVYTLEQGASPAFSRLRAVGDDDDDDDDEDELHEAYLSTRVQLGVRKGDRYEIAVDSYAGIGGVVQLSGSLLNVGALLPTVARRSGDRALRLGETLILTVDLSAVPGLEVQWFFNETRLQDAESPTLVIRNFRQWNVGRYRLRLKVDDIVFFSSAIELQINSEGVATSLARNKWEESTYSGLGDGAPWPPPNGPGLAGIATGVGRGYQGSQIFNTRYATSDPLEPVHCGVTGGASYWFSYRAPADGTLRLDTIGSAYDTLLAVYAYTPPLTRYADLIPVACDNDSAPDGIRSQLEFAATAGTSYFVVLDGVAGARGIAHLNYLLAETSPSPLPPEIQTQPQSILAAPGNPVELRVGAVGTPPLSFFWLKEGSGIPGETSATLALENVQSGDSGRYSVIVSNATGAVLSSVATLGVATAPSVTLHAPSGQLVVGFPATLGYVYEIQSSDLVSGQGWSALGTQLTDSGGMVWLTNSLQAPGRQFYRLVPP